MWMSVWLTMHHLTGCYYFHFLCILFISRITTSSFVQHEALLCDLDYTGCIMLNIANLAWKIHEFIFLC